MLRRTSTNFKERSLCDFFSDSANPRNVSASRTYQETSGIEYGALSAGNSQVLAVSRAVVKEEGIADAEGSKGS